MDNEKPTPPPHISAHYDPDDVIQWRALEYLAKDKGGDWYLALVIIAFAAAASAAIYDNILFAILIIVGTVSLILLSLREPQEQTFELTPKGIIVDDEVYPYDTLESFWIAPYDDAHHKVIIDAPTLFARHLVLPIETHEEQDIRSYLLAHLPEEEIHEPLSQRVMEYLGF